MPRTPAYFRMLSNTRSTDCTPKAVSHRLNNIRNNGKPLPNGDGRSAASTPTKAATTPKTPRGRTKASATKKQPTRVDSCNSDSDAGPEGVIDDDEVVSPSAGRGSTRRARSTPKRSYAETASSDDVSDVYVPLPKRVKSEPQEEPQYSFEDFATAEGGVRAGDDLDEV